MAEDETDRSVRELQQQLGIGQSQPQSQPTAQSQPDDTDEKVRDLQTHLGIQFTSMVKPPGQDSTPRDASQGFIHGYTTGLPSYLAKKIDDVASWVDDRVPLLRSLDTAVQNTTGILGPEAHKNALNQYQNDYDARYKNNPLAQVGNFGGQVALTAPLLGGIGKAGQVAYEEALTNPALSNAAGKGLSYAVRVGQGAAAGGGVSAMTGQDPITGAEIGAATPLALAAFPGVTAAGLAYLSAKAVPLVHNMIGPEVAPMIESTVAALTGLSVHQYLHTYGFGAASKLVSAIRNNYGPAANALMQTTPYVAGPAANAVGDFRSSPQ